MLTQFHQKEKDWKRLKFKKTKGFKKPENTRKERFQKKLRLRDKPD
jgi:hypothetical protein